MSSSLAQLQQEARAHLLEQLVEGRLLPCDARAARRLLCSMQLQKRPDGELLAEAQRRLAADPGLLGGLGRGGAPLAELLRAAAPRGGEPTAALAVDQLGRLLEAIRRPEQPLSWRQASVLYHPKSPQFAVAALARGDSPPRQAYAKLSLAKVAARLDAPEDARKKLLDRRLTSRKTTVRAKEHIARSMGAKSLAGVRLRAQRALGDPERRAGLPGERRELLRLIFRLADVEDLDAALGLDNAAVRERLRENYARGSAPWAVSLLGAVVQGPFVVADLRSEMPFKDFWGILEACLQTCTDHLAPEALAAVAGPEAAVAAQMVDAGVVPVPGDEAGRRAEAARRALSAPPEAAAEQARAALRGLDPTGAHALPQAHEGLVRALEEAATGAPPPAGGSLADALRRLRGAWAHLRSPRWALATGFLSSVGLAVLFLPGLLAAGSAVPPAALMQQALGAAFEALGHATQGQFAAAQVAASALGWVQRAFPDLTEAERAELRSEVAAAAGSEELAQDVALALRTQGRAGAGGGALGGLLGRLRRAAGSPAFQLALRAALMAVLVLHYHAVDTQNGRATAAAGIVRDAWLEAGAAAIARQRDAASLVQAGVAVNAADAAALWAASSRKRGRDAGAPPPAPRAAGPPAEPPAQRPRHEPPPAAGWLSRVLNLVPAAPSLGGWFRR
jgi:hypothetical protein